MPRLAALAPFGLAAFVMLGLAADASAQVTVALTRPPINRLRVTDLYQITAINTSQAPLEVVFRGELTEARAGKLYEVRTDRVTLRPGANVLRVPDLEPISVPFQTSDTRYRDAIVRTNEPPAGSYRVCVYALDAAGQRELGRDCYDQPVARLTPPDLVAPTRGAVVEQLRPTFTWTPPVPPPSTPVRYRVKLVEVLGGQTPEVALRTNPAIFQIQDLPTTVFVYPASAAPLRMARYAWAVEAQSSQRETLAQSRVEVFEMRPPIVPTSTPTTPVTPPSTPVAVTPPGITPPVTPPIAQPVAQPVVTGPLRDRLLARSCTPLCDPPSPNPPVIVVGAPQPAGGGFLVNGADRYMPTIDAQEIEQRVRGFGTRTTPGAPGNRNAPAPPNNPPPSNSRGNTTPGNR